MLHTAFLSLFNSFISHSSILLLIFYYFRYVCFSFSFYNDCHFVETMRLSSLFCLHIQYSVPPSSSALASLEFPVLSKRKWHWFILYSFYFLSCTQNRAILFQRIYLLYEYSNYCIISFLVIWTLKVTASSVITSAQHHRGVEVQRHAFLTSALDGCEWLASRNGRFT
jgi:hypothetical protein